MTPCSPPSRSGLAAVEAASRTTRRPSLTGSARGVMDRGRSGRRNGAPVEPRNKREDLANERRLASRGTSTGDRARFPRPAAGDHRVGEDQQLAGAGDDRNLVLLSGGPQSVVQRRQLGVPT